MNKSLFVCASVLAWFGRPQAAHAGAPAWCNGKNYEVGDYDLKKLSSTDAREIMNVLAEAACSSSAEVDAHRADIDKARQAWGKKFGMADADFADVLAYEKETGYSFKTDFSTKTLAAFTPLDQYQAMSEGFRSQSGYASSDALYVADALDAQLTQVGRLALLDWCLKDESVTSDDFDVAKWAICQADFEKFDLAKVYEEIHADTVHDGPARMWLRYHAQEVPKRIKEVADKKAKLIKKDDEYQKVFDVAAKARAEWAKGVGANTKLLELVQGMDSATFFHSRKLFDGCEAKTAEALATAISTIPAKAFATMHDTRDDPFHGFGYLAAPLLGNTPVVYVAGIAYAECQPDTPSGGYMNAVVSAVPGFRGPRSAALGALMGEKFKFDDVNKKGLDTPRLGGRPFSDKGSTQSAGGVVKSVKVEKDVAVVALEKTLIKQVDCVKEHESNRVARIRPDGAIEYERICDQTAVVTHDHTWTDFKVNPAHTKWLKPGVVFTTSYGHDRMDVLAVWPNKNTTAPSMVLGGTVK